MVKLIIFFTILTAVISTTYGWQPGPAICECFGLVYIDRPKSVAECAPKSKLLKQITQNYNNLYFASLVNGSPHGCDFSEFRERVNNMKERTLQIVEAYFSCSENCTSAIMAAYHKFVDYKDYEFNPYIYCTFTNFDSKCSQIVKQVQPPVYASAENIVINLLTCAKLKSEVHSGTQQSVTSLHVLPNDKDPECNCVKIDPRPIPKDECECFSDKYISTLRNFIDVNFGRILNEYNNHKNHNSTCDYTEVAGYIHKLKDVASAMTKFLEKASPRFVDFDEHLKQYLDFQTAYSTAVRTYILNNDKSCTYSVRKTRQNPLAITDDVVGVLTKCIGQKNLGDDRCSTFLK